MAEGVAPGQSLVHCLCVVRRILLPRERDGVDLNEGKEV